MGEIPNFNAEQHALAVSKPGAIREPLNLVPGGRFMVVDFPPNDSTYTGESASALVEKLDGTRMPTGPAETARIAREILNGVLDTHTQTVNGIKESAGAEPVLISPSLLAPDSFTRRSKKYLGKGQVPQTLIDAVQHVADREVQQGFLAAQAHALQEAEEARALGLTIEELRNHKIEQIRAELGHEEKPPGYFE